MVLVGGTLGRAIGHEGGVLINGISTLIILRLQRDYVTLPREDTARR